MRWASAVSEEDTLQRGLDECVSTVRREMGEASIDLALPSSQASCPRNMGAARNGTG